MSEVFSRDMYLATQWLNTSIGGVGPEGLYWNKVTSLAKLLGQARAEEYTGINSRVAALEEENAELRECVAELGGTSHEPPDLPGWTMVQTDRLAKLRSAAGVYVSRDDAPSHQSGITEKK